MAVPATFARRGAQHHALEAAMDVAASDLMMSCAVCSRRATSAEPDQSSYETRLSAVIGSQRVGAKRRTVTGSTKQAMSPHALITGLLRRKGSSL
jgi:hypothetical protein